MWEPVPGWTQPSQYCTMSLLLFDTLVFPLKVRNVCLFAVHHKLQMTQICMNTKNMFITYKNICYISGAVPRQEDEAGQAADAGHAGPAPARAGQPRSLRAGAE